MFLCAAKDRGCIYILNYTILFMILVQVKMKSIGCVMRLTRIDFLELKHECHAYLAGFFQFSKGRVTIITMKMFFLFVSWVCTELLSEIFW